MADVVEAAITVQRDISKLATLARTVASHGTSRLAPLVPNVLSVATRLPKKTVRASPALAATAQCRNTKVPFCRFRLWLIVQFSKVNCPPQASSAPDPPVGSGSAKSMPVNSQRWLAVSLMSTDGVPTATGPESAMKRRDFVDRKPASRERSG
jgi:hypothetical protein